MVERRTYMVRLVSVCDMFSVHTGSLSMTDHDALLEINQCSPSYRTPQDSTHSIVTSFNPLYQCRVRDPPYYQKNKCAHLNKTNFSLCAVVNVAGTVKLLSLSFPCSPTRKLGNDRLVAVKVDKLVQSARARLASSMKVGCRFEEWPTVGTDSIPKDR